MPILENSRNTDARGSIFNDVGGSQFNIRDVLILSGDEPVHALLNPIYDAGHDRTSRTGPVSKCHQGTRVEAIAKIVRWAEANNDHPICWLTGPAGSGKSAISQTIAEGYAAKKRLAASFFFFRGTGDRNKFSHFIPTLAYQLSLSIPSTKKLIQHVLKNEPTILTTQSLHYQFQKLIIEPFLAANPPLQSYLPWVKPIVIILDGLDECDDRESMAEFIEMLISVFKENRRLNLRIMVASRIEEHIRKKLDTAPTVVVRLSLQDFDARIDIRHFFRSRFSTIYKENGRLLRNEVLPWPSDSDVDALVEKADGSFICAVTLMDFMDQGRGLPQEKLQLALTAEVGLDELYKQVLSDAPRDGDFDRIIGTVMLLSHPLSVTFLGQLLQLRPEKIVDALLGIQSIIMIPEDDNGPIRLYHTSLRDLLVSQPRSGEFFIDPPTYHFSIAIDCLTVLATRPKEGIFYAGGQKYAALNWRHHISQSLTIRDGILKRWSEATRLLEEFRLRSLEFWVNTVLLEGEQEVTNMSNLVQSVSESPNCPKESVEVLQGIAGQMKLVRATAYLDM